MRSGGCTLQQTLTAEAASVVKHALVLARRRGHAQVTPLHVAATLLSLRASSLRRACLRSQFPNHQQHPLQCRALELCFNVALNRLPTTTPTPPNFLTVNPSLSNALIAALKRAQAHQRRGCIEQHQQQPLLAIKVELEHLIISILDDPSVSRVMREAGFSSTAVKTNIEDSSSSSSPTSHSSSAAGPCSVFYANNTNTFSTLRHHHFLGGNSSEYLPSSAMLFSPQHKSCNKEDMMAVLNALLSKKRNTVIVGDSLSISEAVMAELMVKLERGHVPDELKNTELIKFQFSGQMKREEVEMKVAALKRKVEGGGAIFYVGDLKWTVEGEGGGEVEHVVQEIGKLFNEKNSNNKKVWLMGTASYQTYIKCQRREPPLENHWALQPVPVPSSARLALTLHATSSVYNSKMSMPHNSSHMFDIMHLSNKKEDEEEEKLNCCEECASNYEKELGLFKPGHKKLLPSWLQIHTTEAHPKDELGELKRKWNRLCNCLHHSKQLGQYGNNNNAKIYPYNSSYPWWPNQNTLFPDSNSTSISFADPVLPHHHHHNSNNNHHHHHHLVPRFRRQQSCSTIEFNFTEVTQKKQESITRSATLDNQEVNISLALGNSTFRDDDGSGQTLVLQSRAHICKVLQENVPWQSETLPSIAEALVELDSGITTKKQWFLLQGNDFVGKTRLARAIAESVFGFGLVDNHDDVFLHLDMKKVGHSSVTIFPEVLATSLRTKEKLVVLIEDFDLADSRFKKFVGDEFEASKFGNLSKKDENLKQAIFILTSGEVDGDEVIKNKDKDSSVMNLVFKIETKASTMDFSSSSLAADCYLGHKKRRAHELDLFGKINKSPRIEENEENLLLQGQVNKKKDFSRQSSSNTLDLNMKADEEDYDDGEEDESSPISSDLTRDTMAEHMNSNGFLESIENRFEFNQSPARLKEKEELFLNKIKESFDEVFEKKKMVKFNVDEKVIEEIGVGCGNFTNSVFEKWLKDIFQNKLLETVINCDHGKEGIVFNITLCLGGGNGKGYNSKFDNSSGGGGGFMNSCLPKNIQINYFMD
ncbi:hypothetical protein HN51_011870 [Arachis hypogaea]|uniref:Clp R domain-containing protein n=1 Tax=Arachis hypogaea TaxID=3818 RepID=A0A445DX57_ARAHY|nr:uncharacterized protein DS421_3g80650 [Arachis hypogaea]RYR67780.1 hypothetical protein Ahy_A03g014210 [Arachis hypogaea]